MEGNYVPGSAMSPRGEINFTVMVVERDDGAVQIMLRVTEADGTLNHFPLDPQAARWLGSKLIEKADTLDEKR